MRVEPLVIQRVVDGRASYQVALPTEGKRLRLTVLDRLPDLRPDEPRTKGQLLIERTYIGGLVERCFKHMWCRELLLGLSEEGSVSLRSILDEYDRILRFELTDSQVEQLVSELGALTKEESAR